MKNCEFSEFVIINSITLRLLAPNNDQEIPLYGAKFSTDYLYHATGRVSEYMYKCLTFKPWSHLTVMNVVDRNGG